jgi:transcriptional regulator with XRE-family HTH domain
MVGRHGMWTRASSSPVGRRRSSSPRLRLTKSADVGTRADSVRGAQDPAVQRRRLRVILRNARVAANMTQKQVASELYWSTSKLMRIENGTVGVAITDLRALLSLYGITDISRVEQLVEVARIAKYQHWTTYREVLSPEFIAYLGYESAAAVIKSFQQVLLPGLLQTEDYARAVLHVVAGGNERLLQRLLEARLARQRLLLDRVDPPEMVFILDEAALRRRVGSWEIMAAQLEHLIRLSGQPRLHLRVLGFDCGVHLGMLGPFVVLEFADPEDDDVLFLEGWNTDVVVRDWRGRIRQYKDRFAHLEAMAVPESEFCGIMGTMKAEHLVRAAMTRDQSRQPPRPRQPAGGQDAA